MIEIENITIGVVLKKIRKSMKFSQEELAFKSGLDRTYISMLERNVKQPSITTIFLLADALNLRPSELVRQLEDEFDGYTIKRNTL
ncbi:helix-turn-helix domain-containing protein [Sporosarcina sp. P26b]|uniref:helix-turn-helix domain-containing protein n=1 Tax=Sporosarcina sp. P26b TaxID=2048253 RepID=UPI003511AE1E